jgi:hypothetical protein
MASLLALLEQAVADASVVLDAASQHTAFALSTRSESLRAALARRPDLEADLREAIAADDSIMVRRAFLSRADLTGEEITTLVAKERRTTLLQEVAACAQDPELLRIMSTKRGKGLQREVALNPATPDDARLVAAKFALSGRSVSYRDRSDLSFLLASSPSVCRWAIESGEAPALQAMALPLLPLLDGVDVPQAFDRVIDRMQALSPEDRYSSYSSGGNTSEVVVAACQLSWLMTSEQLDRFRSSLGRMIDELPQWSGHSLRAEQGRLSDAGVARRRTEAAKVLDLVEVCETSTSAEELTSAAAQLTSTYSYGASALLSRATMSLLGNPAAPLQALYSMVRYHTAARKHAERQAETSPRMAALVLALGHALPAHAAAKVPLSAVLEAADADGFWPPALVATLLRSPQLHAQVLLRAPLEHLPVEMPSTALQQLVDSLGERTSDLQWLEMALSLSTSWSGRLSELVELTDLI